MMNALIAAGLDLFKLLENDHSNGTKTAERFIQYHLGRIHKELLSLHDAVPDRPPRTFNVYLQWPTTRIQPPANTNHFSGYFQIVSDSINSAYFSSGIRFRLAQSVRPSGPDSGIITSPCDWAPLNTNFRNLVQDYIQSLEEQSKLRPQTLLDLTH